MVKKIVKKFLELFNLSIYKKRNADVIYLGDWNTLNEDENDIFLRYKKSMESSNSSKNNNLAKFSRYYLMSQFVELAIKRSEKKSLIVECQSMNIL